jgi:nucleoside-diphosphate-sugar epimerase
VRYLVTGAAGFIGSHLCDALLAAGHELLAVDCFTDYYDRALKQENAAAFAVDRVDLAEDPLELAGVDGVFHLAGQPGARSFGVAFPTYLRDNVLASQRVFEAAAAAGVRVVFSSSSSVYGNAASYPTAESSRLEPSSPYGITKLASEQLAGAYRAEFGLDVVLLRYFTVYGPRQRPDMFLARVARALVEGGEIVIHGDGRQSRSFTYVGDVVRATTDAMAHAAGGSVYNVGGGDEATLNEAIAILEGIASARVGVTHSARAPGDVTRTKADTSRIRDDLGWEPTVSLEDGLRTQWEWVSRRAVSDPLGV